MVSSMGQEPSDDELRAMIAEVDVDGKITYITELGTVMRSMVQEPSDDEFRAMIAEVDVDTFCF